MSPGCKLGCNEQGDQRKRDDDAFKDPMTTMAAVDRLVHHAVILDLGGVASYRAKQAQATRGKEDD